MHLHDRRVQAHGFDANLYQALPLQALEHRIEHAGLGPAAHARVDAVPRPVVAGQRPPLGVDQFTLVFF